MAEINTRSTRAFPGSLKTCIAEIIIFVSFSASAGYSIRISWPTTAKWQEDGYIRASDAFWRDLSDSARKADLGWFEYNKILPDEYDGAGFWW